MRPITIAGILALAVSIAAYHTYKDGETSELKINSEVTSNQADFNDKLHELTAALKQYQEQNREQLQKLHAEQAEIRAAFARLDTQFQLEYHDSEVDDDYQQIEEELDFFADNESDTDIRDTRRPSVATEVHVSQYLDGALADEELDLYSAEIALEQTRQGLVNLPGVNVDDMKCGTGFCRATFRRVDGEAPDISNLWGNPPFMNQGFTIPREDGSVALYFTESGVSLDDIRKQVLDGNQVE